MQPGLLLSQQSLLLLQDSTRYQKTQALLEKYDPEYVPQSPRGFGQTAHAFATPEPRKRCAELLARAAVPILIAMRQEQARGQASSAAAHTWQGACSRPSSCHCCCLPINQTWAACPWLCLRPWTQGSGWLKASDTKQQQIQRCCVLCRQLAGGPSSATPASVLKTGFGAAGSRVMPLLGAVANLVGDNPELQGALQ